MEEHAFGYFQYQTVVNEPYPSSAKKIKEEFKIMIVCKT